jgi:hypothetical protein
MGLRDDWEAQADNWLAWARTPAGLRVERLVEVADTTGPPGDRWQRIPLFLHLRAVK